MYTVVAYLRCPNTIKFRNASNMWWIHTGMNVVRSRNSLEDHVTPHLDAYIHVVGIVRILV